MRILLTGSNGMVGSNLSKELMRTNHTTLATGRQSCRLPAEYFHDNFNYRSLDITDKEEVLETVTAFKPDIIIHAAAMTQVDECEQQKMICYRTNVDATDYLILAAEEVNARFCYLSTDFVFSGNNGPYKENDETGAVNFYGMTKELAEQHIIESKLSWTILRTILLYGRADHLNRSNFIYWVKNNLEENKPIKVVADQIRTPTFIPDLTKAIIDTSEKGSQGVYHISGSEVLSPYEMSLIIAKKLGLDAGLIQPVDANSFTQIGRRPLKTGFIIEKAIKDINFCPTPFDQALDIIF
ncbi:MAG: SDR family oxidoreductase [Bacteroidota bacterium]|jgi:dTDP-4-dehydrorhamnose reductase|nr:SDR family oxidoreductase [Chitinophagaceae bacterium]MCE2757756.1 SDR family oxidoreductase [Chitinophagaceae bacterium]